MTYDQRTFTPPAVELEPAMQYARAYESFNRNATEMLTWCSNEPNVYLEKIDGVAEAINAHRDAVFAGDVPKADETYRKIYEASRNSGVNTNQEAFAIRVLVVSTDASGLQQAKAECMKMLAVLVEG